MSGGTVEFVGTSPNPVTIWGGNTWSNLTIATEGKAVSFQTNAIQYVYGTPVFSNAVTLQSTLAGTRWKLTKPGTNTNDVGPVSVKDSDASGGMTFNALLGSTNLGNNLNWTFPPTLTVEASPGSNASPGTVTVNYGTLVTQWITNNLPIYGTTQYVAAGGAVVSNAYTVVSPTNVTLTLTNDATLTWAWTTNYLLSVLTNGNGSVNVSNVWVSSGGTTQLTATAGANYDFRFWSGDTGDCAVAGDTLTADMTRPRTITANFLPQPVLTVVGGAGGGAMPGTLTTNYGSQVSQWITNSLPIYGTTQYVAAGWSLASNAVDDSNATNVTLTLTNNATLTWQWTTNYMLTLGVSGAGAVTPASGFYAQGSNVAVSATVDAGNVFTGWTGETNGCDINGTTLTAVMTGPRSIAAHIAEVAGTMYLFR
jgi:hypothetical protein